MPINVDTVDELKEYITGVMSRAESHATEVNEVILALIGLVIWKKDEGNTIKIRTLEGKFKNLLWVTINQNQYVFCYKNRKIEMRKDNQQGEPMHKFNNETSLNKLIEIFDSL